MKSDMDKSLGGNAIMSTSVLYKFDKNAVSRWASRENSSALKGNGAKTNMGAKGEPYYIMQPNESLTFLDVDGSGIIHRIWMTIDDLFHIPEEWRSTYENKEILPIFFELDNAYANPFNPNTTITLTIPYKTRAKLNVYNILGQKAAVHLNKEMEAGTHNIPFNGENFSSGIYFYTLRTKEFQKTRKVLLLK